MSCCFSSGVYLRVDWGAFMLFLRRRRAVIGLYADQRPRRAQTILLDVLDGEYGPNAAWVFQEGCDHVTGYNQVTLKMTF